MQAKAALAVADQQPGLVSADLEQVRSHALATVKSWSPEFRIKSAEFEKHIIQTADELKKKVESEAGTASAWLTENARLIGASMGDARKQARSLRRMMYVEKEPGHWVPRCYAIADAYMTHMDGAFSEETFVAYVNAAQEVATLTMDELWGFKFAMSIAALERITRGGANLGAYVTSLRDAASAEWKDLFELMCAVDRILERDPAGAYAQMDFESRDFYRRRIGQMAKSSKLTETEIAEKAVELARDAADVEPSTRANERRRHVGFYLIDLGQPLLKERIGYRASLGDRLTDLVLNYPSAFYMIGVELATFVIVALLLSELPSLTPVLGGLLLLLLPATHAAVHFMNILSTSIAPPRIVPKLDYEDGIPAESATAIAVPALLMNEKQVRNLVRDVEIRYLANRQQGLYFGLLTDSPDSDRPIDEHDRLVDYCGGLIEELNERYGPADGGPFFLLHRQRIFNPSEGAWMGWERKRGKILDLNRYLTGGADPFPVKFGAAEAVKSVRYVITLDSDTQLPRGSAAKMIGAMAHPLNRAVVDPRTNTVVEGYGLMQPRVSVSIQSASRSRLAAIYSGQTGFDIYTRAISDVYQDLFGEGIFTGKGIYDVEVFRNVLENRFPTNALLSHDLIEGVYVRTALVSDIEVVDDYPSHYSAFSRRQHRWMRGDWQVIRWLLPLVPDFQSHLVPNPMSLVSRWKILDNLRRTLIQPATLVLLLAGWFWLPGPPFYWTVATILMLLIPVYSPMLFLPLRMRKIPSPAAMRQSIEDLYKEHLGVFLQLAFLVQQSLAALDAIIRTIVRTSFTKRKLLEWETAAQAESTDRKKAPVDLYLELTPLISLGLLALLVRFAPQSLAEAAPVLFLWAVSPLVSRWLNRPPAERDQLLSRQEMEVLRGMTLRTWRYFREFSTAENHYLIPDNVQEEGTRAANRLSPTNLGLLLNARVAAVELGYLSVDEFCSLTRKTVESAVRLPRFRGHFLNWYDAEKLTVMEPQFVSTVDSGNLAVALWTLKQACCSFKRTHPSLETLRRGIVDFAGVMNEIDPVRCGEFAETVSRLRSADAEWPVTRLQEMTVQLAAKLSAEQSEAAWWGDELLVRLRELTRGAEAQAGAEIASSLDWIAEAAGRLVDEMDYAFLFHPHKKLLSVGYDVPNDRINNSWYDLLASEARMAVFIAIAKGDIPQEAWFHLGRTHTLYRGSRLLISWSGTAFEYLMPMLWMRHYPETLLASSMKSVVEAQRRQSKWGRPWGISEAAYGKKHASGEHEYGACGIPEIALKSDAFYGPVISPYSTFLALQVDPEHAYDNLRRMQKLGWMGSRGFYESADYSAGRLPGKERYHLIRSWMAHHEGMSLLAASNLVLDNRFQDLFHEEPYVEATERLLHERLPADVPVAEDVLKPRRAEAEAVAAEG